MIKVLWLISALVFTILVYSIYKQFRIKPSYEFFSNNININFCPYNTKEFINNKGDSLCCSGTIDDFNRECNGTIICSRSSDKNSCAKYIENKIKIEQRKCPSSMPVYYTINNVKRCTNGQVNQSHDTITKEGDKHCVIYDGEEDRLTKPDSCYLHKYLENLKCKNYGDNCAKMLQEGTSLIMLYDKLKPLGTVNGINTFCYDMKHYNNIKKYVKLPDMSEQLCGK